MNIFRKITFPFFLILLAGIVSKNFAQTQFVENKGQWDDKVKFRTDFPGGSFFLQSKGFRVMLHNAEDMNYLSAFMHGNAKPLPPGTPFILHSHAYDVDFLGASPTIQAVPEKMLPNYNNYFLGSDPAKWKGDCKIFQAVTYENVYPNIDVRYYTDGGNLKYDFVVKPGGNVDAIALRFNGVDKLEVVDKQLSIGTSVGTVKELYPYTYQALDGKRSTVDCRYVVRDNVVRFKVKDYDRKATIVIDPTLIFSSFTGSSSDNWGYTATPGPDGSFFAGGISFGAGYPVTTGAYQTVFAGGVNEDQTGVYDIAIMKLSPDGSQNLWATYLGGSHNEQPHSMMCDASGSLVIAGRSKSDNYPQTRPRIGPGGGYDIVVTKLAPDGRSLMGSVKIGGTGDDGVNIRGKYVAPEGADATRRNYGDDARSEVILDGSGNIYVASCSQSSNFPVTSNAFQKTFGGARQDGVVMKFKPNLSDTAFVSYFGGSGDDACFVLSLNPANQDIYVAGGTTSTDLPGDVSGVISPTNQGLVDGFVTSIKNDGSAIIKMTYQGTGGNDLVYGIQFDKFGFPYIMGTTTGNWTVFNAPFSQANSKQFISKLKPDLSGYVYSTTFGTSSSVPNLSPVAFLVDRCQNVYVSGWGGGININKLFPSAGTSGLTEVNPLAGIRPPDGADFYFFVLEKNAQSLLFGSHFGQYGGVGDHVDGGTSRFDANGIIYQAVCANCGGYNSTPPQYTFPTTFGVWAPTNGSNNCNEACVKIEMNFAGVGASVRASINGIIDTIGCVPLAVNFTDTLAKGKMYIWDYGDITYPKTDTTYAPNNSTSHTYNNVGSYRVRLVSIDSSTCNISDTAYVTVRVGNNDVTPDFNFVKLDSCNSLRYQFNNTTTAVIPTYTNKTFLWEFGDGSAPLRTGYGPVIHTFPSIGSYIVTLVVDDTTFCNEPDSAQKTVRISPNVIAKFTTKALGCVPYNAEFTNTSQGGTDFYWDFGDGTGFTLNNAPVVNYTYNNVGTYNVRLVAIDTSTCNKRDTSGIFTITVSPIPKANFTWTPNPAQANTPTQFINQSSNGANHWLWDFGDGETSTIRDPLHQYNATGTYHATLYAYNAAECVDSISRDVPAIILPLMDVPNAFTPDRFGTNGIISVVGFGIGKMDWRIYNRQGLLVFRTNDRKMGWDGKYKGVLQPMDTYTYTLDVEFTDGNKIRKTGDITLLR